jgi:hypothetical protein
MVASTESSVYARTRRRIAELEAAVTARDTPLRRELIALIESGRHVLIGAQAVIHYTEPRFTQDTDYAVDIRGFRRVRKWLKHHKQEVNYRDVGEALHCDSLGIDILNGGVHPVLAAVLRSERSMPSPEGLAAFKYVSMTSDTRPVPRRLRDAADFSQLVLRPGFDTERLLAFMVPPYDELRGQVEQLIADIKAGKPIQI